MVFQETRSISGSPAQTQWKKKYSDREIKKIKLERKNVWPMHFLWKKWNHDSMQYPTCASSQLMRLMSLKALLHASTFTSPSSLPRTSLSYCTSFPSPLSSYWTWRRLIYKEITLWKRNLPFSLLLLLLHSPRQLPCCCCVAWQGRRGWLRAHRCRRGASGGPGGPSATLSWE